MTQEEKQIAQAAYCVGKMWDEYEGTEDFDRMVGKRVQYLIELVRKSQPSLPSVLDKAAHEFEDNAMSDYDDIVVTEDGEERPVLKYNFTDAFKAGAEWMAGQGEIIKVEILSVPSFPSNIDGENILDDEFDKYCEEHFGKPWDGCVPVGCFELSQMAEYFFNLGKNYE